jgi:hypothetical protein
MKVHVTVEFDVELSDGPMAPEITITKLLHDGVESKGSTILDANGRGSTVLPILWENDRWTLAIDSLGDW